MDYIGKSKAAAEGAVAILPPKLFTYRKETGLGEDDIARKDQEQVRGFLASVARDANVKADDLMADFKALSSGGATDASTQLKLSAAQLKAVSEKLREKVSGLSNADAQGISQSIAAAFGTHDVNTSGISTDAAKAKEARVAVSNFGHALAKAFEGGALLKDLDAKGDELRTKITKAGGVPGTPSGIAGGFPPLMAGAGALAGALPMMAMGSMGPMMGAGGFDPAAAMLMGAPLMNAQELAMCAQLPPDQQALFYQQKMLARQQQMMMYISNKARVEADTAKSIIQNIR
jgi:hypothetical protein